MGFVSSGKNCHGYGSGLLQRNRINDGSGPIAASDGITGSERRSPRLRLERSAREGREPVERVDDSKGIGAPSTVEQQLVGVEDVFEHVL